jgi:hypothetical protein
MPLQGNNLRIVDFRLADSIPGPVSVTRKEMIVPPRVSRAGSSPSGPMVSGQIARPPGDLASECVRLGRHIV